MRLLLFKKIIGRHTSGATPADILEASIFKPISMLKADTFNWRSRLTDLSSVSNAHQIYICRFITKSFCVQSQFTGNQLLDAEAIDQIMFCDFIWEFYLEKLELHFEKSNIT